VSLQYALGILGAGMVLLALGGEAVIRGGVLVKRGFGAAPVIVGVFVLSLGTAAPTLAVAVEASMSHLPDLAVGTVIGAVLINLLLVLGLAALIRPMPSPPKVVGRDGGAMLLAAAALVLFALTGTIGRRDAVVLLLGFVLYAAVAVITDWRRSAGQSVACAAAQTRINGEQPNIVGGLFATVIGIVCLVIGAHFLIGAALALGSFANIAPPAMAVTLVAFAVSLPLAVSTLAAAARGTAQTAVGHLLAVSIFDILGVLGVAALVHPLAVAQQFARVDVLIVLGAAVLLVPLMSANWRLTRPRGALLLFAYVAYLGYVAWQQGLLPHGLIGP
jgi:cation:H+ antiporter